MRRTVRSPSALELGERGREACRRDLERQFEDDLHLVRPRHARQRAAHEGDGVEVRRRRLSGAVQANGAEAVGTEGARFAAPVVVRGHVPAPAMGDEAVGAELALGFDALARRVARLDAPPADDGLGQSASSPSRRTVRVSTPSRMASSGPLDDGRSWSASSSSSTRSVLAIEDRFCPH
jgi:hypothetical protein